MHVLNGQWLCCVVIRSPCKLMQGKCDININRGCMSRQGCKIQHDDRLN